MKKDFSFDGKNILLISPEPWGKSFVSKHHYAKVLADRGNVVYFLNPPTPGGPRDLIVRRLDEIPNLRIIDYRPVFRGLNRLPGVLMNFFNRFELGRLDKAWGGQLDVVWSFDPFRFQRLDQFHADLRIYHAVDVHNVQQEKIIATSASIIFATSDKILDRLRPIQVPKYKVGHGLAEHFTKSVLPKEIPGATQKLKIGYVGNLHIQSLAKEILLKIVTENPGIDFFFIGPHEKSNLSDTSFNETFITRLKSYSNVHLLGTVPSYQLPEYMAAMDMFLICYAADARPAALANPHKLLEYLSTGKAVVCTYTDEYKDKRHLVEMADFTEDLPEVFSQTIKKLESLNGPEKKEARKKFALENTYDIQLHRIENYIKGLA